MSDEAFESISELWAALRNYTAASNARHEITEGRLLKLETTVKSLTNLTDTKNALHDADVSSLISEIENLRARLD